MTTIDIGGDALVHQISTPSLGDHSYVVILGDKAAVIDPQRDIDRFAEYWGDLDAEPAVVAETHIHNDYVSGGSLISEGYGCRYVLPADSGATLDHQAVRDGDLIEITDGWSLRALHTPGHTPHHTSYVLVGPGGDVAVFTGGSMLVGAVGRTDLISPEEIEGLTRSQYRSVRRLASDLDDPVAVAPTHGAGSFCAAGPSLGTSSTIGIERRQNPALTIPIEDLFVASQISGFGLYPAYYQFMAPINRGGASPVGAPPSELSPDELEHTTALVIDVRDHRSFAVGHVPQSINIPASETAATYAAWVGDWNRPAVIVGDSAAQVESMRLDMARIGYDRVAGFVSDGLKGWKKSGRRLDTARIATFDDLSDDVDVLLDVRDPKESTTVLPGAVRTHLSQIDAQSLDEGTIWIHCVTGYRATIAASMLRAQGRDAVAIVDEFARFRGETLPA